MTERLFVCHAKLDLESTSEVIDGLETALDFPSGSLLSSSLPGYSSDSRSEEELRAMLAGTSVVLALVTETSVEDPEFSFELGAAWALGIEIMPVLVGATQVSQLPWPLRSNAPTRLKEPGAWEALVSTMSERLGAWPRRSSRQAQPAVATASVSGFAPAHDTEVDDFVPPPVGDLSDDAVTQTSDTSKTIAQSLGPQPKAAELGIESPPLAAEAYATSEAEFAPAPPASQELSAEAYVATAEARYLAEEVSETSAIDPGLAPAIVLDAAAVSIASVVQLTPAESGIGSEPRAPLSAAATTSAVFARLPSCEMSFEAGRAVSDCLFNRDEISNFESELAKPLGIFVDAMGGSWDELRQLRDFDVWMSATENLIDKLPPELRRVNDWYQLGFELAILHNLAGQLVLDGAASQSAQAEATWRAALERFLVRAENVQIGYEKVGRVLSLLENLAGPRAERDLSNISRSLEEVRRYAAGADGIHTAA